MQHFGVGQPGFDLKVVPYATHDNVRVQFTEHGTNVLAQLPDELLAHRRAFDGDFWENFND